MEKQDFGMDTVFLCGCGEGGSWHCHGLLEKSVDTCNRSSKILTGAEGTFSLLSASSFPISCHGSGIWASRRQNLVELGHGLQVFSLRND